jgi:hypothetical protein
MISPAVLFDPRFKRKDQLPEVPKMKREKKNWLPRFSTASQWSGWIPVWEQTTMDMKPIAAEFGLRGALPSPPQAVRSEESV